MLPLTPIYGRDALRFLPGTSRAPERSAQSKSGFSFSITRRRANARSKLRGACSRALGAPAAAAKGGVLQRRARSAALRGHHDAFPGIRACDLMKKLWLAALAVLALGLGLSQAAPQGERFPCCLSSWGSSGSRMEREGARKALPAPCARAFPMLLSNGRSVWS